MFSSGSLPGRQIQPVYGYFKSPLYYITHLEVRTRVKKSNTTNTSLVLLEAVLPHPTPLLPVVGGYTRVKKTR